MEKRTGAGEKPRTLSTGAVPCAVLSLFMGPTWLLCCELRVHHLAPMRTFYIKLVVDVTVGDAIKTQAQFSLPRKFD